MPIGNSDGQYFEDYQRYAYDLPEENQDKNLSQSGVKQPLRVTITPHMQAGESEQGSPEGGVDHKVFFVRHGETPENETNTIREKDTMLTDKGRQQAEQAAEKLKEEGVTNLFSSTLPRAQDSANIIAAKLGITPQFDSRLNTWGMGSLEGQPCSEENLAKIKSHIAETPDKPLGGEESFNDFKDRTFAGIRDSILNGAPGKTAILTHSKVEDALERWNKTGQENPSLDVDAPIKEEKPGSVEPFTMKADSTIMQPATYSKQQFAGGPGPSPQGNTPLVRYLQSGVDLNPVHKPGTKPVDYLRELLNNPDILERNIEQASMFNFVGSIGKIKVIPTRAGNEWDPGPHAFDIIRNTEQGERKIGNVTTYYKSKEKDVHISWIDTNEPSTAAWGSEARRLNPHSNALSRSEILDLMREIAREFPEAETVSGHRISGLHALQFNSTQTIPIPKRFREAAKAKYVPQAAWEPELLDVAKERLANRKTYEERMLSDEPLPAEFEFPEVDRRYGSHPRDLDQIPFDEPLPPGYGEFGERSRPLPSEAIERDVIELREMYPEADVRSYDQWGENGQNPYTVFTRAARENNSHTILVGINGIDHAIGDMRRVRTHDRNIFTGELSPHESSHDISYRDEFDRLLRERERPSR